MSPEFKDYYAILGVPRNASEADIKKAFRQLARKYHPDVAPDPKAAEEKFKEINEAHEVLGNADNRRKYDLLGADWKQAGGFRPPPGGGGNGGRGRSRRGSSGSRRGGSEFHFAGTGFSDFFEHFFGPGGGDTQEFDPRDPRATAGRRGGSGAARRGEDLEGDLAVSLDEVQHGGVRTITLEMVSPETGAAEVQQFKVRIPVGVTEGQRIRVPGKGHGGWGGGPAGDLLLRVRLSAHPDFEVHGSDLHCEIPLAPWDAVLGTTLPVRTLGGEVSVRIPPGTQPGQRLRVRGHGLPRGASGEHGDLYVAVQVRLPTDPGPEEKSAWERLAALARPSTPPG